MKTGLKFSEIWAHISTNITTIDFVWLVKKEYKIIDNSTSWTARQSMLNLPYIYCT